MKYYYKDHENEKIKQAARRRADCNRNRRFIWAFLLENPCIDCGESDPIVLDFDHVRGEKIANVCQIAYKGGSIKRIEEEMAKCEVRCSNCHRKKTARQFGQYEWVKDLALIV